MYSVVYDALLSALFLSLLPMIAIALGAGMITLLQAIMQIQEQSVVHLARLVVMAGCLLFFGQQAYAELERIFVEVVTMAGNPASR